MPSSISSSDIPYREIPDRAWGQAWVICVVLVIAAVAGWELKAREMQHVPGDYDGFINFTAQWAEERRKLDEPGHGHRVVLLGSSRMLWAAVLCARASTGESPAQKATPGTKATPARSTAAHRSSVVST